jgi:hypothetical protein
LLVLRHRVAGAGGLFLCDTLKIKKRAQPMRQEFSEKESADSMQAAASLLGAPLELVKRCKRQGSRAFRGSRIYLKLLAEEIAAIDEPDTVPFNIPTGPHCNPETVEAFQQLLRVAIRARFLTTGEILEIILDQIIEAWGPKLESKELGKSAEVIHLGFGAAVMLLEADPAPDDYLKRTAAKLNRNAQKSRKRKHLVKH